MFYLNCMIITLPSAEPRKDESDVKKVADMLGKSKLSKYLASCSHKPSEDERRFYINLALKDNSSGTMTQLQSDLQDLMRTEPMKQIVDFYEYNVLKTRVVANFGERLQTGETYENAPNSDQA